MLNFLPALLILLMHGSFGAEQQNRASQWSVAPHAMSVQSLEALAHAQVQAGSPELGSYSQRSFVRLVVAYYLQPTETPLLDAEEVVTKRTPPPVASNDVPPPDLRSVASSLIVRAGPLA